LATAECREPARSDRLQVRRSESPTGYSSAGCSPAKPASVSPITDHRSSIPIQRLAVIQCRAGRVRRQWGCHLYFARRVTFLSCADTMVLILSHHPPCRCRYTLSASRRGTNCRRTQPCFMTPLWPRRRRESAANDAQVAAVAKSSSPPTPSAGRSFRTIEYDRAGLKRDPCEPRCACSVSAAGRGSHQLFNRSGVGMVDRLGHFWFL
jgi:hypothetical protein